MFDETLTEGYRKLYESIEEIYNSTMQELLEYDEQGRDEITAMAEFQRTCQIMLGMSHE